MRLFAAVDLSEDALTAADRAIHAIGRALPALDVRWVPRGNMHVTVRFIGWVADDRAPEVLATLSDPIGIAPFRLVLGACGAFPASGAPRVLWIGLREGSDSLARVADTLNRRLAPLGYPAEDRPFSAHVTLARAVRDTRLPRGVRDALSRFRVRPAATDVTHAVLYQSHLSPKGPRYEALVRIPLSGRTQLD